MNQNEPENQNLDNSRQDRIEERSSDSGPADGVQVVSRYDTEREIREMEEFLELAATEGVIQYLEEVFYDSKGCICSFSFAPSFGGPESWEGQILRQCALHSISQFEWFGDIAHGRGKDEGGGPAGASPADDSGPRYYSSRPPSTGP